MSPSILLQQIIPWLIALLVGAGIAIPASAPDAAPPAKENIRPLFAAPTITSVVDSPDPADYNVSVSFTVDWNDGDGDNIKAHICKTDAMTTPGTCDGGAWVESSVFTATDPEVVNYTTQSADEGVNNYFAFVCDEGASCSGSTSGTFDVEIKGRQNLPSQALRVPAESEWTDHGTIETGGAALAWDDFLFGSFNPAAVTKRDDNKFYLYYIGADGIRGDGGPANRKVGVTTCDLDTDDCLDEADWTKSGSNPIWSHIDGGDDETGTFTWGANTRTDDSVVMWMGNMVNCGAGCVNDDVDAAISSDGVSIGSEVRLLTHSDTTVNGWLDEIDGTDAYYDGTNWQLFYSSANGNRDGGGTFTWGIINVVCPDWDDCDESDDPELFNDQYPGNVSVNYLDDTATNVIFFANEGANVFDGTGDKTIEVYTAPAATPEVTTLQTSYTFTDIDNSTVYLDTSTNTWWMFYFSTANEDIRVKTAPANAADDLLVRYYMDEATSGQGPTQLLDSANTPLNLTITYDVADPAYTSAATGEGLEWTTTATDGRAEVSDVDPTKLKTELHGSTTASLVVVAEIQSATASNSRVVHIGNTSGESGRFSLHADPTNDQLEFWAQGETNWAVWNNAWNESTPVRECYVVVIDTTVGTAANRVVLYDSSGLVTKTSGTDPALNETIDLSTGREFVIGNRESGAAFDRAIDGIIYYVDIRTNALTSGEASTLCTSLIASDDASQRRIFFLKLLDEDMRREDGLIAA